MPVDDQDVVPESEPGCPILAQQGWETSDLNPPGAQSLSLAYERLTTMADTTPAKVPPPARSQEQTSVQVREPSRRDFQQSSAIAQHRRSGTVPTPLAPSEHQESL